MTKSMKRAADERVTTEVQVRSTAKGDWKVTKAEAVAAARAKVALDERLHRITDDRVKKLAQGIVVRDTKHAS